MLQHSRVSASPDVRASPGTDVVPHIVLRPAARFDRVAYASAALILKKPINYADTLGVTGNSCSRYTLFWEDERGQDLVEYSLLLALITLVAIGFISSVGGSAKTVFSKINSGLTSAAS